VTNKTTQITSESRKEMPLRGRAKKTIIMEALRKEALSGVSEDASNDDAENAWFAHLIKKAFDSEDKDSGLCLRLVTERGWAALKPSSDCVTFEFDKNATTTQQASQVMNAVSEGHIPPDLGLAFVGGIKSMIEIEANTELKVRIENLEEMMNAQSS
jgi:hypothetical protein